MSESSLDATMPTAMPVLSRGKHRSPLRGACFMEYTSLLAGEPFTDEPRCVDRELAAVLRAANDKLSDADRPRLAPLLGRAIGLTVEPPPPGQAWRRPAPERRRRASRWRATTRSPRDCAGTCPGDSWPRSDRHRPGHRVWSGGGEEVAWLFWDLMTEPTTPARRRSRCAAPRPPPPPARLLRAVHGRTRARPDRSGRRDDRTRVRTDAGRRRPVSAVIALRAVVDAGVHRAEAEAE